MGTGLGIAPQPPFSLAIYYILHVATLRNTGREGCLFVGANTTLEELVHVIYESIKASTEA